MRRVAAILALCFPGPAVSLLILGRLRWALGGVTTVAGLYVAASLLYGVGASGAWIFLAWAGLSSAVTIAMVIATFTLTIRTGQSWQTWGGCAIAGAVCYAPVAVVWATRHQVVESYAIPSMGMAPTLVPGDYVVARKRTFGGSIASGNVVIFTYPSDPNVVFVARVAGTAGQRIEVRDGTLVVDGRELPREPAQSDPALTDGACNPLIGSAWAETHGGRTYTILTATDAGLRWPDFGPTMVPDGMFFAIGDNRDSRADSRVRGAARLEDVLGVVSDRWLAIHPCTQAFRSGRVGPVR